MKKVLCISLLLLLLSTLFLTPVSAVAVKQFDPYSTVEYYPDGSYGITTLTISESGNSNPASLRAAVTSGTKNYTHYDSNNNALWKVTLTGFFSYTGTSATCTSATTSYVVYDSVWKVTNATASHSGNTATGEFTTKKYVLGIAIQTVNKTLTLTCSPTGTLS